MVAVEKVTGIFQLENSMAKITQNAVMVAAIKEGDKATRFMITNAASVASYLTKFKALDCKPRSGYDKYYNDFGFTNPLSPKSLSPQGVGCLMAALLEHASELISRGGDEANEMTAVLDALDGYREIAAAEIAKGREVALAAEAHKLGLTPEKLAQYLSKIAPSNVEPAADPIAPIVEAEDATDDAEAQHASDIASPAEV